MHRRAAAWRLGAGYRPHRHDARRHAEHPRDRRLPDEPAGRGPLDAGARAGAARAPQGTAHPPRPPAAQARRPDIGGGDRHGGELNQELHRLFSPPDVSGQDQADFTWRLHSGDRPPPARQDPGLSTRSLHGFSRDRGIWEQTSNYPPVGATILGCPPATERLSRPFEVERKEARRRVFLGNVRGPAIGGGNRRGGRDVQSATAPTCYRPMPSLRSAVSMAWI
jgi:hypothetical protein